MALILCYECEKEISDEAPACPHCGAPKAVRSPISEYPAIPKERATKPKGLKVEVTVPKEEDEGFGSFAALMVGVFVFQIARALELQYGAMTVVFMLGPWWLLHAFGKKQSTVGYWVAFIWLGLFYWLSLTAPEVESVDIWRFAILITVLLGCLCSGSIEKWVFWWKR